MNRRASAVLLGVTVAAFALAGGLGARLVSERSASAPAGGEPLDSAPPPVVFTTIVLGGFRGVLADILWLRASRLQDQGRYFELVQLAEWITALEPRHTEVWAFHAWNMAYNASVMMPDPEDRWRWVQNGIDLLRRDGLRYNPGDPLLYRELGWLFQNKIGTVNDRDNRFYRMRLAREMDALFAGARPDFDALSSNPDRLRAMRALQLAPGIMRAVDARYGPLDWRLPETHAVYWAARGLSHAGHADGLMCERMIYQSLAALFLQGRLLFAPERDVYLTGPELDLFPRIMGALDEARERHGETIDAACRGFLNEAVLLLHLFGRDGQARAAFARLRELYPSDATAGGYERCVETLLASASAMDGPAPLVSAVAQGWCYRARLLQAGGRADEAADELRRAGEKWNAYLAGMPPERRARLRLPTYEELQQLADDRARRELAPAQSPPPREDGVPPPPAAGNPTPEEPAP